MSLAHVKVTAHKENLSVGDPHVVLELSGMDYLLGGCKDTHKEFISCDVIHSIAEEYETTKIWR